MQAKGGKDEMVVVDVRDSGSVGAFAEQVAGTLHDGFGRERFDHLVNNAGVGIRVNFAETTEEQFDELVAMHLRAPVFLTQKLLPIIEDGGRILNVSSGFVRFTTPGFSVYAAMKGALDVLTRFMAVELGARRIRVND